MAATTDNYDDLATIEALVLPDGGEYDLLDQEDLTETIPAGYDGYTVTLYMADGSEINLWAEDLTRLITQGAHLFYRES